MPNPAPNTTPNATPTPTLLPVGTPIFYVSLSTTTDHDKFFRLRKEPDQFDLTEGEYCISEVRPGDTDAPSTYSLTLVSTSPALCAQALLTPSYLGRPFSHVVNKRRYFGCWALSLPVARYIVREYLFTWAGEKTEAASRQYEEDIAYYRFIAQDAYTVLSSD